MAKQRKVTPVVRKAAKALASPTTSKATKSLAGHVLGHQANKKP